MSEDPPRPSGPQADPADHDQAVQADQELADHEPDVRFLLANERTLLAWLRTALALLAGGVGLLQFLPDLPLNDVVGFGMLVLGTVSFLVGLQRYRAADAALRANQLPLKGVSLEIITLLLFLLAAALIVIVMTHRATTI